MTGVDRLYFNPSCSKARGARDLLAERDHEVEVVDYRKHPPTLEELTALVDMLEDDPAALVRRTDPRFKDLGLDPGDYRTAATVVALLHQHPELMERPVFVHGDRAVIGRPPERVLDLL